MNRVPSSKTGRFWDKAPHKHPPLPKPVPPSESSEHFRNIFRFSKFGNVEQGNKKWDYPRKTGILGGATIYVFGFPAEKVEFLKTLLKVYNNVTHKTLYFFITSSPNQVVNRDLSSYERSYFLQDSSEKSPTASKMSKSIFAFPRHETYIRSRG